LIWLEWLSTLELSLFGHWSRGEESLLSTNA